MKVFLHIIVIGWALLLMSFCGHPNREAEEAQHQTSSSLSVIDSLMWRQPESAFALLLRFADTTETDSFDTFEQHYFQLLVAELLYKNDFAQTNRFELQQSVAYFDSLSCSRPVIARHEAIQGDRGILNLQSTTFLIPFLSARTHYINGVGYYENDSVVEACAEYLKALETMEDRFEEKELVGKRAQFMALVYAHLTDLFSNQYLHEQAICFGKYTLSYYNRCDASASHKAWVLEEIGSQYEIMECFDTAGYYYHKGLVALSDTIDLIYRDLKTHLTFLSYKTGEDSKRVIEQLYRLIAQAESEEEKLVRYAFVGEVFYQEKQFDSAWHYLLKEYENSSNVGLKKQAAEWLVEICEMENRHSDADEFTRFLIPFANLNENQSHIKSQLTELYQNFKQKKQERQHQLYTRKAMKWGFRIVGFFVVLSIMTFVFGNIVRKNNKRLRKEKQAAEKQLESERYAHKMKQKALGGRLKQSNAALRKQIEERELDKTISKNIQQTSSGKSYSDEPICQYILSVCNDDSNRIKSTIPVSAYVDIALNDEQKAQLRVAAIRHYSVLFENLKILYPKLKEKDLYYCYLCLLGLDNTQIAAMLQLSYRTIWEKERRLQMILGTEANIAVTLFGLMSD